MFEDENLNARLDFILEAMMDDCVSIIEHNADGGADPRDTTCAGIYHGNVEVQITIANALIDPRIRNAFIAHWTDTCLLDTADAVGSPLGADFLLEAASAGRKKTGMYLGIIEHSIDHTSHILSPEAKSAISTTVATLALLDGSWETATLLYLKALDENENDEFAQAMAQTCVLMRGKATKLITEAFDSHSIEDLLAGTSLL
jgi:hypothetical protein